MSDTKKAAKVAIQSGGKAKVRPIFIGKLASQVEANLVHHSAKVIQSSHLLLGRTHGWINHVRGAFSECKAGR